MKGINMIKMAIFSIIITGTLLIGFGIHEIGLAVVTFLIVMSACVITYKSC